MAEAGTEDVLSALNAQADALGSLEPDLWAFRDVDCAAADETARDMRTAKRRG